MQQPGLKYGLNLMLSLLCVWLPLYGGVCDADTTAQTSVQTPPVETAPETTPQVKELIAHLKEGNDTERLDAVEALGRLDRDDRAVVPALLQASDDSGYQLTRSVRQALAAYVNRFPKYQTLLIKALKDDRRPVMLNATFALSLTTANLEKVTAALLDQSLDEDDDTRMEALSALGNLPSDDKALIARLVLAVTREADLRARMNAGVALGRLAVTGERARAALSEVLKDRQAEIRGDLLTALGYVDSPSTPMLPILLSALKEEVPSVRQCAELTLYKWAGNSETMMTALYAAYPAADAGTRVGMIDALYKLWLLREPGRVILRQALKDPDAGVRQAAVRAIATDSMDDVRVLKLPEWLSAIKATLNDPAVNVRLEAVEGLLQLDDNEATDAEVDTLFDRILREGLKQSDAKTRERSARLAIRFTETGGQMTDALYAVVDDPDPLVRDSALIALSRSSATDPRFTAVCVKALKDAVPWVRVTAARALARQRVKDAALIPILLPLLREENPELRAAALEGITRIADRLTLYPRSVETAELPTSIRTLQEALLQLNSIRKAIAAPPVRPPEAVATGDGRLSAPPDPPVLFVHLPEAITAVRAAITRLQGEQIRRAVKKERFQPRSNKSERDGGA